MQSERENDMFERQKWEYKVKVMSFVIDYVNTREEEIVNSFDREGSRFVVWMLVVC